MVEFDKDEVVTPPESEILSIISDRNILSSSLNIFNSKKCCFSLAEWYSEFSDKSSFKSSNDTVDFGNGYPPGFGPFNN